MVSVLAGFAAFLAAAGVYFRTPCGRIVRYATAGVMAYAVEQRKKELTVPEEKRTDVNIGIHMVDDAYQQRCDHEIVVSGDSDLVSAIKMVRQRFPNIGQTPSEVPCVSPRRDLLPATGTSIGDTMP